MAAKPKSFKPTKKQSMPSAITSGVARVDNDAIHCTSAKNALPSQLAKALGGLPRGDGGTVYAAVGNDAYVVHRDTPNGFYVVFGTIDNGALDPKSSFHFQAVLATTTDEDEAAEDMEPEAHRRVPAFHDLSPEAYKLLVFAFALINNYTESTSSKPCLVLKSDDGDDGKDSYSYDASTIAAVDIDAMQANIKQHNEYASVCGRGSSAWKVAASRRAGVISASAGSAPHAKKQGHSGRPGRPINSAEDDQDASGAGAPDDNDACVAEGSSRGRPRARVSEFRPVDVSLNPVHRYCDVSSSPSPALYGGRGRVIAAPAAAVEAEPIVQPAGGRVTVPLVFPVGPSEFKAIMTTSAPQLIAFYASGARVKVDGMKRGPMTLQLPFSSGANPSLTMLKDAVSSVGDYIARACMEQVVVTFTIGRGDDDKPWSWFINTETL